MARIETSNTSEEDFWNNTTTLTIRGLTDEQLMIVAAKLDELGWGLKKKNVRTRT